METENINKQQVDVEYYYKAYFDDAQTQEFRRDCLHLAIFVITLWAVFVKGHLEYVLLIVGAAIQVVSLILKVKGNISQVLANETQKAAMLQQAYSTNNLKRYDIAQLKGRTPRKIYLRACERAKVKKGEVYTEEGKSEGDSLFVSMIKENIYFNHHLYQRCAERSRSIFAISFIVLLIIVLVILPLPLLQVSSSIPKVILMSFSSFAIWEQLEKALIWSESSKTMHNLLAMLNQPSPVEPHDLILIFASYNSTNAISPLIPERLYEAERPKLNDGWASYNNKVSGNTLELK